jgi:hypothetical protein
LLPDRVGEMAWSLANIAILVCALHMLARDVLSEDFKSQISNLRSADFGPRRPRRSAEGALLMLSLAGSAVGIWSGQSNAVVAALILLALAAIVRRRWWTVSLLLAVPVFIKIWPLAIVLLLAVFWPRQLIGRFLAGCAGLAFLPFLTRPPATLAWQYQEWYRALAGPLLGRWPGYRDLWTVWETLRPPVNGRVYMILQLAAAAGVLAWCLWQSRTVRNTAILRQGAGRCDETAGRCEALPRGGHTVFTGRLLMLIYAMWAAWQLLFGPGTEQLTCGLIAPAASWAVLVSFAERRGRWLTVAAWAIISVLPSGDIEKAVCRLLPWGTILLPLGVVLFVAWLLWHERGWAASLAGCEIPSARDDRPIICQAGVEMVSCGD